MLIEPPFDAVALRPAEAGRTLADQLGGFDRAARGAFSANTERAVRSDLGIYGDWCAEWGLSALPATPETVAAFVDAMAATRSPATVRRYVASIAVAHRAIGQGRTLKSPVVRLALKRMHRRKGRRQGQAHGMTWPLRQRLIEAAGDRPIDLRNRALLAVAYDAMLRRAELTSLEVSDFLEETPGDATLLVRRGKTDGEGPRRAPLPRARHRRPGARVARAQRHRGGPAVPLGRQGRPAWRGPRPEPGAAHPQGHGAPGRTAAGGGGRALGAQRPGRRGPGHDRRRHRAAGDPSRPGRWKSTAMVNRYGERLLARRSGAAQLARLQRRD